MIDISNWIENTVTLSSGTREKKWFISPDHESEVLFKKPRENTTEFVSEKLAEIICKKLDVSVARVEIVKCNGQIGSISYKIDEFLMHGTEIISGTYGDYNKDNMFLENTKEYYSIDMILKSLEPYEINEEFIVILFIDFLIGNTDRHDSNWAIILDENNKYKIAPLYDNGSSLCSFVNEEKIDLYFKDGQKFRSLVDTKSRSLIRINSKEKKRPTHLEMIEYISSLYKEKSKEIKNKIINNINESFIDELLAHDDISSIISDKRKKLIKEFLKKKVEFLKKV